MNAPTMDVSVIIVSWNVSDLLRRCLQTVKEELQGLSGEVFVVDNASLDDSVAMVRREFPWVRLIANPDNRGFSAANNQGIELSSGRVVVLLNPDTEVYSGGLRRLVQYLDQHPDVGVAGPKLLRPDGSIQKECARRTPTLLDQFYSFVAIERFVHPYRLPGNYAMGYWDHLDSRDVEAVSGACMAVRREVIQQVGGLDEQFTLCGEDLDWCLRIAEAGWRVTYRADAEVLHYGGASMKKAPLASLLRNLKSQHRFYLAHRGPVYASAYAGLVWAILVPRLLATSVVGLMIGRFTPNQTRQRIIDSLRLMTFQH